MTSSSPRPEIWPRKKIAEIFEVRAAGDIDWSRWSPEYDSDHPFPVYANGRTDSGLHGFASYAFERGDAVTLTARGTPGELGFAFFRASAFTPSGRLLVLRSKGDADAEFFASYINSIVRFAQENTGVAQLTAPQVTQYEVALPTLNEQQLIAALLRDVDALLAALDRLIAKKRDLKQAAKQQLLTGQTRLPGFRDEWEGKRLGELGVFLKGSGIKKDESSSGDLPCIRYGEIYTHHHDCVRSFNSWIAPDVAKTATRLRPGDLLFAGSGETKAEIGKCVAFVHECEAYAGGDIVILRPFSADPVFMGYYCNTSPINAQKASKGQGDAVVHISAAALGSISIRVPVLAEQTAIATILSEMDAELKALEARLTKTRALKQGMMQELLTGRTRLV